MAERRIAEGVPQSDELKPGPPREDAKGIICYISNYSWLDGLSHTGMRERFMEVFDSIHIDCLNGDKYKTGKRTPDGKPDPSVMSTEFNPAGIQVGTAIALLERRPQSKKRSKIANAAVFNPLAELSFRHWWGNDKRAEIEDSLEKPKSWQTLAPIMKFGLPLVPLDSRPDYEIWPKLTEVMPKAFSGVKTARDRDLVSIERETLQERIEQYFDKKVPNAVMRRNALEIMSSDNRFKADEVRAELIKRGQKPGSIVRYCYRPFDVRWLFWELETKLLDERRAELHPHIHAGNLGFILAQKTRKGFEPPVVSSVVASYHVVESVSRWFPLQLADANDSPDADEAHPDLFASAKPTGPQPNLTDYAREYLAGLKCGAEDLFFHIVAVLHAPLYREENAGALRQDWPRVPLPKDADTLRAGAALGRQIAALLDPETPVPGVTDLKVRTDLKGLGELAVREGSVGTLARTETIGGEAAKNKKADKSVRASLKANPMLAPDLAIAARWGYAGQGGVTMPGPGKVTPGTRGEGYLDIHLNATTRWKDVPVPVWNYTIGGYQVLKKWLSYREHTLLSRPLTSDEAQDFTHHVRRITAILTLHGELDAHYGASV